MTTQDDAADHAPRVRLVIVDDHQIIATSLTATLESEPDLEVAGVAHDVAGAVRILAEVRPDVVLLDHRLPDGDGVTSLGRLRQASPDTRFVVLTASTAEQVLVSAIEAGAAGFVSKTRSLAELTAAVRAAAAGEAVISPELLARLLPRMRAGGGTSSTRLTQREIEVLELMARGLSNAAIAEELVVSVHTVRNHVANLSLKLDAHSKLEAVSRALREGIIAAP
jgi:DNA-binding NarL/FixJ family response regulator